MMLTPHNADVHFFLLSKKSFISLFSLLVINIHPGAWVITKGSLACSITA
jgi:hypothetical protein